MKTLILALAMMVSLASFSQSSEKFVGIATSGFITNYGETGVNLDVSLFASQPRWFPSINADAYTAAKPEDRRWTTAQVGVRLNIVPLKHFIVSAGPKYVTQGGEKTNGYNQFIFDGAVTYLGMLAQRDDGIMWFKASVQYNSTPQQRVLFLAGLQFALR